MKEKEIINVIVNTAVMIDLYLFLYFEVIYKDTIFYELCQRVNTTGNQRYSYQLACVLYG